MRRKVPKPKIKTVQMKTSESLYNKVNQLRLNFKEINGMDLTLIQAGDILAKRIKIPKIPNLLKDEKNM